MQCVLVQWPAQAALGALSGHSSEGQKAPMAALTKKLGLLQVLSRGYLQTLRAIETIFQMSPSVIRPGASILPRYGQKG